MVAADLGGHSRSVPAELGRHQLGRVPGCLGTPVTDLDPDPGAPGKYVIEADRALVRARVHDFRAEVRASSGNGLLQPRAGCHQVKEAGDIGAVAAEQPLDLADGQPGRGGDLLAGCPQLGKPGRAGERNLIGPRSRCRPARPGR